MDERRDALEAVDLAPRDLPAAEIALQIRDRLLEHLELQRRASIPVETHHHLVAGLALGCVERLPELLAPDECQRLGDGVRAPAIVPAAQYGDRLRETRALRVALGQAVIGPQERRD